MTFTLIPGRNESRVERKDMQGGIVRRTICSVCNEHAGNEYIPDYLIVVREADAFTTFAIEGLSYRMRLRLNPLRALKQVLVMCAATSGEHLAERQSGLRNFLIHPESQAMPKGIRIYPYFPFGPGKRQTGYSADFRYPQNNIDPPAIEICYPPVSWLITLNGEDMAWAEDVSWWSHYRADVIETVEIIVPRRWTFSSWPMDFRSPRQVRSSAGSYARLFVGQHLAASVLTSFEAKNFLPKYRCRKACQRR